MKNLKLFCLIIPIVFLVVYSCDYDEQKIKNIKGRWLFSVGDNTDWADPGFDDVEWDRIYVPSYWEEQGYRGYNGYAWYRKHIRISRKFENTNMYLFLGKIDDVDEVYFNGTLIGNTGSFPPNLEAAYTIQRKYYIPKKIVNLTGDNVIAVRVYDVKDLGGIRNGKFGIYKFEAMPVDLDLSGIWKFHINDSLSWNGNDFNDNDWDDIHVPGFWEDQGYNEYDGFAWYRRNFDLSPTLMDKKLVILVGKIDDIDQVYLNGKLIGQSGEFNLADGKIKSPTYWNEFRGYFLPREIKLKETANTIAVRVYDSNGSGGIYEGPVGIITQENYSVYWKKVRRSRKFIN